MDKLTKRPNETDLAYHKRLIYGKLVDGTLADEDYSELYFSFRSILGFNL